MYRGHLFDKAEALDVFKAYKAEVKRQQEKKIKIVQSGKGGEYYGSCTEKGQMTDPFAKFPKEEGIIAQTHINIMVWLCRHPILTVEKP